MYIEGASLYAPMHDLAMLWVNFITITAFLLVNGVLVYFIIRYRRRSDADITSSIDHNTTIEVIWTVIPTIILTFLYIFGLNSFKTLRHIPEDALEISVKGKQWVWDFTYPSFLLQNQEEPVRLKSTNILYLEENRPTKLIMQSQDVIHSFFIPAFRVKEDIVPGMYTYITFTPLIAKSQKASNRGEYNIFCAEYCGRDHSAMLGKAIVLPKEDFMSMMNSMEEEAGNVSAEIGESIHKNNCISCHSLDGSRLVGPSFKGLWQSNRTFTDGTSVIADENYIRSSILEPNSQVVESYPAAMPVQDYTDSQIDSIIEFLKSL